MAERLLRPDEVKEAAEWFFGLSVVHLRGRRATARVLVGKRTYWQALKEIGLSLDEIADVTGAERSGIHRAIHPAPPQCYVDGVLDRARSQMMEECNP